MSKIKFIVLLFTALWMVATGPMQTAIAEQLDCNSNSIDDSSPMETDCNGNGVPDQCDIASQIGFSPTDRRANVPDMNMDGTKDFIDFATVPPSVPTALRVTFNFPDETTVTRLTDPCTAITGQFQPQFIGVSDATGDGLPDIFVTCDQPYIFGQVHRALVMQQNLGVGNFKSPQLLYQDITYQIDSVGEINGDGAPDIFGTSYSYDQNTGQPFLNAVILLNDGTNHFLPIIFPTDESLQLYFADLNGDNAADILTQHGTIYWNNGFGNFSAGSFTDLGMSGVSIIADIDGDGLKDAAASQLGTVDVFYSNGDTTFQHTTNSGFDDYNPSFADFNGDGKLDVVSYNALPYVYSRPRQADIYIQGGRGVFTHSFYFRNFEGTLGADIDGDGKADRESNGLAYLQRPTTFSLNENSNAVPDECEPNFAPSMAFTFWNTFLDMVNVLELRNNSSSDATVVVIARGSNGFVGGSQILPVPAHQELDLLVSEFLNLPPDSYGNMEVTTLSGGPVQGGVSLYHLEGDSPGSFATHMPLVPASRGVTAGIFNNIYPIPATSALRPPPGTVQDWLSIFNPSFSAQRFRVIETGQTVIVPAQGRVDVAMPIRFVPSPGITASTIRVQPFNSGVQYLANISRFGFATSPTGARANFLTSHHLQKPTGKKIYLPIETSAGTTNIVEVHSAMDNVSAVEVSFYDHLGMQRFHRTDIINGLLHYPVNGIFGPNENGYAVVSSLTGITPLVAQVVSYSIDSRLNLVAASDSMMGKAYFRSELDGGYNLYLGMRNFLRVINPSMSDFVGTHTVGSLPPALLVVGAGLSGKYELVSPLLMDSYGNIDTSASPVTGVFGDVMRVQYGAGGAQFALSSPLN